MRGMYLAMSRRWCSVSFVDSRPDVPNVEKHAVSISKSPFIEGNLWTVSPPKIAISIHER